MQTQGDAGHLIFSTRFHTCGMTTKHVDNNKEEIDPTPQELDFDTMLKTNGPNSLSNDALKEEECT